MVALLLHRMAGHLLAAAEIAQQRRLTPAAFVGKRAARMEAAARRRRDRVGHLAAHQVGGWTLGLAGAGMAEDPRGLKIFFSYGMLSLLLHEDARPFRALFLQMKFRDLLSGVTLIRRSRDSDPPKMRL